MGGREERHKIIKGGGGGKHSLNQKTIGDSLRFENKIWGNAHRALKAISRRERIERSQEEFEETKKRAEDQRISYETGLSLHGHIEGSGNAGLNVESVKEGLPTETIEQLQEGKERYQEGSTVKKPQLLSRLLRVFVRNL